MIKATKDECGRPGDSLEQLTVGLSRPVAPVPLHVEVLAVRAAVLEGHATHALEEARAVARMRQVDGARGVYGGAAGVGHAHGSNCG